MVSMTDYTSQPLTRAAMQAQAEAIAARQAAEAGLPVPTVEEINIAFKEASETYLHSILEYTSDPLVSVDIVGNSHSVVFDSELTSVIGNMVKLVGWYDNEAGYSNRLVDLFNIL